MLVRPTFTRGQPIVHRERSRPEEVPKWDSPSNSRQTKRNMFAFLFLFCVEIKLGCQHSTSQTCFFVFRHCIWVFIINKDTTILNHLQGSNGAASLFYSLLEWETFVLKVGFPTFSKVKNEASCWHRLFSSTVLVLNKYAINSYWMNPLAKHQSCSIFVQAIN